MVNYGYYADGKLAWTMVNNDASTRISMKYDDARNRIDLVDPDYGRVSSHYNAFGQLLWTASPKGDLTEYEYDDFGRTTIRTETDMSDQSQTVTHWNYSDEEGTKGLLLSINYNDGEQIISYEYDNLNRVETMTETLFDNSYSTHYQYDALSRLKRTEYPSLFVTENVFSPETGMRIGINDSGGNSLWQLNQINALGQITEYQTGDGTSSTRCYDNMHRLESQIGINADRKIQDFCYSYDDFSNLASRKDNKFDMTETFTYDKLNRLETICTNGIFNRMLYDEHGRILAKQELSFDAWGNTRDPYTWTGQLFIRPMFDRGFTGHEHLFGFDLINMNGRVYDPVMSSFLSVDSYVQDPDNSQNFNRYAYCFNNPLKYTDPSGEVAFVDDIIAAAIVGAIINGFVQTASGNVQNFGQWCLATTIGGVAGAAGAWAGGAVAMGTGFVGGAVSGGVGGAVGGFANGAGNAWMNGGSFGDGMMCGISAAGSGALGGGIMGGIMGGINAATHDGNFWNGKGTTFIKTDPFSDSWDVEIDERLTYSDKFIQDFVDSNFDKPDNLIQSYANDDGWIDGWERKGSYFTDIETKTKKVVAISKNYGFGKFNVMYSRAAFSSPEELYMTIAHEHLHLRLYSLGYYDDDYHHASISRYELAQAKRWNHRVDYYRFIMNSYTTEIARGNYYSNYSKFVPVNNLRPIIP